jgi:hypothetical protein
MCGDGWDLLQAMAVHLWRCAVPMTGFNYSSPFIFTSHNRWHTKEAFLYNLLAYGKLMLITCVAIIRVPNRKTVAGSKRPRTTAAYFNAHTDYNSCHPFNSIAVFHQHSPRFKVQYSQISKVTSWNYLTTINYPGLHRSKMPVTFWRDIIIQKLHYIQVTVEIPTCSTHRG